MTKRRTQQYLTEHKRTENPQALSRFTLKCKSDLRTHTTRQEKED